MASKNDPRIYLDITRVDDEQRTIECYGTRSDMKDSYGTFIDLDSAVKCMGDYMEYPALREMHQPVAAGSTVEYSVDDKGVMIRAKVVDDNAWKKVKENVYRGLSIGARQAFTVRNGMNMGVIAPSNWQENDVVHLKSITEYSLVDSPSNRGCGDLIYRISGMEDENMDENEDVKRYAGEEISDARTALSALDSIQWLMQWEKDEADSGAHPEAAEQVAMLQAAIENLKKFIISELKENTTPGTYIPGEMSILELAAGADADIMRFAVVGADGAELTAEQIERVKAALVVPVEVERSGSRHSTEDMTRLNNIRDNLEGLGVEMCRCGAVQNAAGADDNVQRLTDLADTVTRLQGETDTLRIENAQHVERIKKLEDEPAKGKAVLRVIDKGQDFGNVEKMEQDEAETKRIAALPPEQQALEEVKRVHQSPTVIRIL